MPTVVTFTSVLPQMGELLELLAADAVHQTASEIAVEARASIKGGSKTGRIYTSGPEPLPHQASAPGQAPANWTDELADSIEAHPLGLLEAEVVAQSPHAGIEVGMGRVAPRPYLVPAAELYRPVFEQRIALVVSVAAGRAGGK